MNEGIRCKGGDFIAAPANPKVLGGGARLALFECISRVHGLSIALCFDIHTNKDNGSHFDV